MENIAHVNRAALGTKRGPSSNEELCDDKSKKGKIEVDQPSVGKDMAEISLASKNKDLDDGNKSTDQSLDDDTEARVKSTVHGNADTPEDILTAINRLQEKSREFFVKMTSEFKASKEFESLCLVRLDSLIKDARALDKHIVEQKDQLQNRLNLLSKRLNLSTSTQ